MKKLLRRLQKLFFFEQWLLAVCDENGTIISLIKPRPDRIWADPFPVLNEGRTYVFIEQQLKNKNGTLGFIELFDDFSWSDFTPILETDYHLSYPHIFKHENQWYMIPETHEHNKIDLYICENFPQNWKYHSTLLENTSAVDTTILNHNGNCFLFTSTQEEGFNSSLSIFYSNTFPSVTWESHPENPVIRGKDQCRMGGSFFIDESNDLIRPTQSSIKEYGEKLILNKVTELSKSHYAEEKGLVIEAEKKFHAVCTHTWNKAGNIVMRDIKIREFKLFYWLRRKNFV